MSGIHDGGPGVVDGIETLHHQLQGVEQRKHRPRGVGIDHNIRTAAAAHVELNLGCIVAQQGQHVAYGTHQQEAIVAVLAVGDGGGGTEIQLFNVIAGRERHHRRKDRARLRGVTRRIGGRDLQRLAFGLLVEEGVAVGAIAVCGGGHR